jgi:ABC-2 type transport system permease protein
VSSVSSFFEVTGALARRNIRISIVRPVVTLIPMVIPLIFFATFAGGLGQLGNVEGFEAIFPAGYTSFQFVFVWLQGSAFQGMFSGFLIARDFESGFAKRLMLAAPNRAGIIGGYLASSLLRATLGAGILFGVGFVAGVRVTGSVLELFGLIVLGFALTVIAALWSAGIALRFRTIQAGPLMQMPVFIALFLSPVFVPLALLTGWIKTAARIDPITVFMEQGRNFIAGTDPKATLAFGVALGVTALGVFWAIRGLRSAERAG